MSLLSQSTVLAYDVEADNIIWKIDHATMHQHDVDIINSNNGFIDISIFDNNTQKYFDRIETLGNEIVIFRSIPINKIKEHYLFKIRLISLIIKMERIKFENLKKEFVPKTISGGRSDFLNKNNSIMIEETDYGRIFEIDYSTKEILWQYVNKTDKGKAPFQLSWTRRLNKLPTNFKEIEFKNCIQNYDL